MQMGFHFDQSRCLGCYACIVACEDWHDVKEGANWVRVTAIERGKFPDLSLSYLFITCLHCSEPLCIKACPVNAIIKREEDGIVIVDRRVCFGSEKCSFACQKVCPYKVPELGPEPNAKMQKCDLCLDRWAEGKKPVCVNSCPMRALDVGSLDKLRAKYGDTREAEGFVYSKRVMPSIIFKQKLKGGLGHRGGFL